ncbi:uncharacterized protein LOC112044127 [Bicyclus anynana]|uniref:Uncharacterized protein LOC112044127 n=1 Tax=Bicyclus anynana TaxID=110368 RepID=A0A6J1MRW0_BICAN|nr:uncharacterized protein LOC112044127 [Bicyclus anynana]
MYLFHIFICVVYFNFVRSLSEVDQSCINSYKSNLDNSFLIGTWYSVCEFAPRLDLPSSNYCRETVIKNATDSDKQRYREGYRLQNPFNIDDNPVIAEAFIYKEMIMGNAEAKFVVYDPKNYFYKEDLYGVRVFRKVSEDYMLVHECRWRGNFKSLLSRKRNITKQELNRVIATINDVKNMEKRRFCTEDIFF